MRSGVRAVMAVAAVLFLSACAPAYDQATAAALRGYVVDASTASAAGDWKSAIGALDELGAALTAARGAGKVDDTRFGKIVDAMELVRQDLDKQIDTEIALAEAAADAVERQRLLDEQARLQQQITELQEQASSEDEYVPEPEVEPTEEPAPVEGGGRHGRDRDDDTNDGWWGDGGGRGDRD
ncbi:hypothetical protein [Agromyces humi]|uniref:hypothetical protein n=1 Tax=Agromyces humi TaxID=1766800 RepID=UPI00135C1805|nr:hypothetical protein [Agromyces humi]